MTSKEIIKANIEFKCDERIGFNFDDNKGRKNDIVEINPWNECDIVTHKWHEGEIEYYTDLWGNIWHRIIGKSEKGEIYKPVLENWDMLDDYELPDLANPKYYARIKHIADEDQEYFLMGMMPGWIFATCRDMRRMDIYFMDLHENRQQIDILHGRFTALLEGVIDQFGKAGMDGIFFCEDLGTQNGLLIGPDMWRDIYQNLYERLTSRAHQYGMKVIQRDQIAYDAFCDLGLYSEINNHLKR